jgi:excisionase family DNA binding protein
MTDQEMTTMSPAARETKVVDSSSSPPISPWLTVREAAQRARCGSKLIYREVKAGRLRATKVGGRRELRLLSEWIDEWLMAQTTYANA